MDRTNIHDAASRLNIIVEANHEGTLVLLQKPYIRTGCLFFALSFPFIFGLPFFIGGIVQGNLIPILMGAPLTLIWLALVGFGLYNSVTKTRIVITKHGVRIGYQPIPWFGREIPRFAIQRVKFAEMGESRALIKTKQELQALLIHLVRGRPLCLFQAIGSRSDASVIAERIDEILAVPTTKHQSSFNHEVQQ